jgi:hypothetical protein
MRVAPKKNKRGTNVEKEGREGTAKQRPTSYVFDLLLLRFWALGPKKHIDESFYKRIEKVQAVLKKKHFFPAIFSKRGFLV